MTHPSDVDISTCIDCRLYAGLCPVHSYRLLQEARLKYYYDTVCAVCNIKAKGLFCKECGSQKDCNKCGLVRSSKDPFCNNCGEQYKITEGAAAGNPVLPINTSTEVRFCEECGRSNPGGYCTYCGTPFVFKPKPVPAETPKSPCPQCKTPRHPDAAFCMTCGFAPSGRRASRKVTIFQNKALRVYCVSCGGPAGKGTFCIYCGVKYHKEQRKDQYDFAGEATPAESPIQKPDVEKLKKTVRFQDSKEAPSPTARTGKGKTFGEQLRERQQQGDLALKPSPSLSPSSTPPHTHGTKQPSKTPELKKPVREIVTTDSEVRLSPRALKQFMDMWQALPDDQKEDNTRDIRKALEGSKPLLKSTPEPEAAAQILKDSGAGSLTPIHLTTLQEQGKQFDSVAELAKEVGLMHTTYLQRKEEEKETLISLLNDPIIWTTLFPSESPSSSSSSSSSRTQSKFASSTSTSTAPLMKTNFSSSSSRLTTASSVPMLSRDQITELVTFENSASGVVNLLTDLHAKGRKYNSTDQMLSEAKALSLTRRQDILSFLNDSKRKLFSKPSKLKEADVEKLYQITDAGSEILRHLKDLEASGQRFDNFDSIIPAVRREHEKRVQQILKVFPQARTRSNSPSTTRPTSKSAEAKKSSKPAPTRPAPRIRATPAEPDKAALKTLLKDQIEMTDQVSEEFIEDLLIEGETVGETMDLVSELKDAGVHLEEIPVQDIPSAFRAARIHRLATLKSIQAVTSGQSFKKILNLKEMNLEDAERLYHEGKQGARTPHILKSMMDQGANFSTMDEVVTALQTYKDDIKSTTIESNSTDSDIQTSERSPLARRVVTEKEKQDLRTYLVSSGILTKQNASQMSDEILVDLLSQGSSFDETCQLCNELHAKGVQLNKLKSGEAKNIDHIKRSYNTMRKKTTMRSKAGFHPDTDDGEGELVYIESETVGDACCVIL